MKLSALQKPMGLALQAKSPPPATNDTPKLKVTGVDTFEKSAPKPSTPAPSQVRSGGSWCIDINKMSTDLQEILTQEGLEVLASSISTGFKNIRSYGIRVYREGVEGLFY